MGHIMASLDQKDHKAESTEHLRMAQMAAQFGTWEWDPVTGTQSLSQELHRIFGTDPDDPDRVAVWASRVHPQDWPRVQQHMEESQLTGIMEFDYRYLQPQRGLRWLFCRGSRFPNETRMFGIVQDITARKLAEEGSSRYAAIVASSDDAIISKDLRGIVTSWNPAAEQIFGFTAEEMIGQSILKIIPPDLWDQESVILSTIASGERIQHFETVRMHKSGELIDISLTVSPIRNDAGIVVGAAKIARDITQRRKSERALQVSERLATVGRLAATVAHEINNPLEAVINLVFLARHSTSTSDTQQYLAMAEEELERVSQLTRQTLGFYRESKGAARFRLGEIVTSLLSVFASRTRNRGIVLSPEIDTSLELYAVPGEIRQVVANLVSNSIDALEGGGTVRIRVHSAIQPGSLGLHGLRLTVADSGSGIPFAVRAQLFQPFFTTKKDLGTGLGLWVCKSIVEKLHGSIRMRSATEPGKSGTVFSVFLPLNGQESEAEKPVAQAV
jgi:PAS domain S-box-containing protein